MPGRFIYIINTHAHHDHYRGNSVFPDAQIVGHEKGPGEMEEYWKDPDILFSDSLGIDMGDVTFELKYFGRWYWTTINQG